MFSRRQFLLGLGAAALGNLAYARWLEPHWLHVTRPSLPAPVDRRRALPPLRVLQLSDLHYSPDVPLDYLDDAITLGLAQQPDLIALTGDYITGAPHDPARYAQILARLPAAAPTFACLGNHDGGAWGAETRRFPAKTVTDLLTRANIPCLYNRTATVTVRDRVVQVIGVGDLWAGVCDPATAFAGLAPRGDALRLVLNHNPDAKILFQPYDWDVMLCGHTHGGQIRLPLYGPAYVPVRDRRYIAGLYNWNGRWLHVSCGVGNLRGYRYLCRPEVSLLTIA